MHLNVLKVAILMWYFQVSDSWIIPWISNKKIKIHIINFITEIFQ